MRKLKKYIVPALFFILLIICAGCSANTPKEIKEKRALTTTKKEQREVHAYRIQDEFGRKTVDKDYLYRTPYWNNKGYVTDTGIPYCEAPLDYDAIRYVDFSDIVPTQIYVCFDKDEGFSFLDFLNCTILDIPYEARASKQRESVDIDTLTPGLFYIEVETASDIYTVVYIAEKGDLYLKGIYNETKKYLIELIHSDELPKLQSEEEIVDTDKEPVRVPCVCGCGDFEDECTDDEVCKQPDYILGGNS